MARERRSVRRSAFTSDKLSLCNDAEFLLFVGLLVFADDDGRESGRPESLKTKLASRNWSASKVSKMMSQLNRVDLIDWYCCDCGSWYEIVGWDESQRGAWQGVSKVDSTITSYSEVHCKQCSQPLKPVDGFTKNSSKRSEVNRSEVNVSEGDAEPDTRLQMLFQTWEQKITLVPSSNVLPALRTLLEWLENQITLKGIDDWLPPEEILSLEISALADKLPDKQNIKYFGGMVQGKLRDKLEGK